MLFIYRYMSRESCSQFDSLPLTYLTKAVAGDGRPEVGGGESAEADERVQRSRMCLHALCEIRRARRDVVEVELAPGAETALQRDARRDALAQLNASPWGAADGIAGAADALVSACAGAAHTLVVAELNARTIAHVASSASAGGGGATGGGASAAPPPSPLQSAASDDDAAGVVGGVIAAARCALRRAPHDLQRELEWRVAANILNVHVPGASAATVLRMRDSVLLGHALLLAVVAAESAALDAPGAAAAALRCGLLARIARCVVVEFGHARMATDDTVPVHERSAFARFWALCDQTRVAAAGIAYDARLDHPLPRAPRVLMTEGALRALVLHTCAPFVRCVAIAARALRVPWQTDAASELNDSLIDDVVAACVAADSRTPAGVGVPSAQGALISRWCGAWLVSEIGERAMVEYTRFVAAWVQPQLRYQFAPNVTGEHTHPALLIDGLSSHVVVPESYDHLLAAMDSCSHAEKEDYVHDWECVRCLALRLVRCVAGGDRSLPSGRRSRRTPYYALRSRLPPVSPPPRRPPNCPSICPRRYPAQLTEKRDVYRQALLWIGDTRAFAALAGAPGAARVPLLTWTETGHVSWAPIRDTIARCVDEHRTLQAGVDAVGEGSGAGARAITHDDVLAAPPPRPLLELECLPTSFTDFHAGLIARRDFFSTSIDDTTQVAQCLVCGYVYGR